MTNILIVEDEKAIADLLEVYLKNENYNVIKYYSSTDVVRDIDNLKIDLAILDVMMPEIDGFKLCSIIRKKYNFPIIFATARVEDIDKINGLSIGADDYVTKPFNIKVLISRCNNLVRTRRMLYERFNHMSQTPLVSNAVNEQDQELIDRATAIIRKYFDDIDFDMNVLASELGIGRSKLYLRIKEITGLTPNELTLKIKLEEAMYLLNNQPNLNISEISYQLGFSSPRYFSKCFKSFYGVSPQNCRKGVN